MPRVLKVQLTAHLLFDDGRQVGIAPINAVSPNADGFWKRTPEQEKVKALELLGQQYHAIVDVINGEGLEQLHAEAKECHETAQQQVHDAAAASMKKKRG